jgi:hypothetical protein
VNIELRYVDKFGVEQGILPDAQKIDVSPVLNDYGTVAFDYPKNGLNWSLLKGKDEFEIAVYINGVKRPELGAIVKDISGDDVAEASIFSYSGNMLLTLLDEGRVYPNGWPTYDHASPNHVLPNYTAGMYMGRFIDLVQQRGALQGITWNSFSPSLDSNGQPWTKQISLEIKPGPTVADILRSLYSNGICEFRMVGHDLRLYNPGTLSVDRTLQSPPLTFRKGRDLRDSPRKVSSREVATVFLGAGKEDSGTYAEEVNATAVASRRRIEGYASNGNITDSGTMHAYLQLQLQASSDAKMEKTSGLEFVEPDSPRPLEDFDVGDWAYIDVDGIMERYRIKQWVLSKASDGSVSGSVTMNDMFAEAAENLSKRIDGILGGTTVSGESKAVDTVPGEVYDNLAPAAPNLPVLSSTTYTDRNGATFAQVTVSWLQVVQNTNGTPLTDLAGYRIRWSAPTQGLALHTIEVGNVTTTAFSSVAPDVDVQVAVQAFDKYGNASAWSPTATIHSGNDTTPTEAPSTPSMDNYAGLARAIWDGGTASGAAWPKDFSYSEVHFSAVNNFTPTYGAAGTLSDSLTGPGKSFAKGIYGQVIYCRLVAVDTSGNKSAPSGIASVTPNQILGSDIFDGAVGTAKLADAAITNAKIANLAVNAAQIGSVNAGSIVAGAINAELTVAARIATALTGKRSEMNAIGFQAWNAAGTLTLSLDGENNLMMGKYLTALAGRRIEIGAGGSVGQIDFYGPAGQLGQIRAFSTDTTDIQTDAITMRYPIAGMASAWNQFSIGSNEEMYGVTGYIGLYIGGSGTGLKGFQVRWSSTRGTTTSPIGAGTQRFIIAADGTYIYAYDGNPHLQLVNTGGSDYWSRFSARSTAGVFAGTVDILFYSTQTSPALRMFASNMANAGHLFYDMVQNWFGFVNGNQSAFIDVRGNSFVATSDESAKKSIRKFNEPAREKLAGLSAHTYAMRDKDANQRRRIGFLAADAPEEVRVAPSEDDPVKHEGIDLYGLLTLDIQYSKEIDADLEALRSEVAALREELASR